MNRSRDMMDYKKERINSRSRSPNMLYPPELNRESNTTSPDVSRNSQMGNFLLREKHSIDRISAISRENSLNNSKRS